MTDIHIPAAALEAGARAAYEDNKNRSKSSVAYPDWQNLECSVRETYCSEVRAAFNAMLSAWPGMQHDNYVIVLPLTENPNAEA